MAYTGWVTEFPRFRERSTKKNTEARPVYILFASENNKSGRLIIEPINIYIGIYKRK